MIGNDLVHIPGWSKPEGNRHQRFLNKLFLPAEQHLLKELPAFGEPLLWSMKEAAYKLMFRREAAYRFAPKSFFTRLNSTEVKNLEGVVIYGASRILTQTQISGDYLHTIALAEEDRLLFGNLGVRLAYRNRDERDYQLQVNKSDRLLILKDEHGVPKLPYPDSFVSISHDGDKIAYVWIRGYKDP